MTGHTKHIVYAGTSGWAYPSWKPEFYPASVSAKKLLAFYATRLNTVEVNYTFRSLPSASTVQTWLAETSTDFRFSFKAPQRVTHILRLKNCNEALERFGQSIAPVAEAGRLGLVLFQLPPNLKADVERLSAFLMDAEKLGLRMAFEFRNESWFCADTYAVLRAHSAALCIAESDELATPEEHTTPFSCYRFRRSEYSDGDLSAIRSKLRERASKGDVFAYFKHEEAPTGALRAARVLEGLRNA
ncbi:MAG: DUF72 domain-containing protein [Acidobacteriaceae bacterium]